MTASGDKGSVVVLTSKRTRGVVAHKVFSVQQPGCMDSGLGVGRLTTILLFCGLAALIVLLVIGPVVGNHLVLEWRRRKINRSK
jgi:hypothetical protein